MANENEEVRYDFTADTDELRKATKQAIDLLGKYGDAMKATAKQDSFKASKTSVTGLHKTINGLIKDVNSVTSALNKAGGSISKELPTASKQVSDANKNLADSLKFLQSGSATTSADFQLLDSVLKDTRNQLDTLTSKIAATTSEFKTLNTIENASATATKASTAATKAQTTAQQNLGATIGRVQEEYQSGNKAARDSAQVFMKSAEDMTTVSGKIKYAMRSVASDMQNVGGYARTVWKQFTDAISPVMAKVQSLKDKFKDATNNMKQSAGQTAAAVKQFTSAFAAAQGIVGKVTVVLLGIASAAIKATQALIKLARKALPVVWTGVKKVASGLKTLGAGLATCLSKVGSLAAKMLTLGRNMKQASNSGSMLKKVLTGIAAIKLGQLFAEATKQSISYIENMNLFRVAMGESIGEADKFVRTMQEVYGMDPSNLMRYAGNFFQLATAIEMPDKAAQNLSLTLTKATADISSLFNTDIDTVFQDLSSGMQGMARSVRKYGMDIRVATLQQTALTLGMTEQVESMSEANRQGLRFLTMMKQASNASGDFARTIEAPANQLKILKEQISQLGRAIGNFLVGPLGSVLQYLNGIIMAIRTVLTFIGSITGAIKKDDFEFDTGNADKEAKAIGGIGSAAKDTAKEMKKLSVPFDELNVLSEDKGAGAAGGGGASAPDMGMMDPELAKAIEDMGVEFEAIEMKANKVRDSILDMLGLNADADGNVTAVVGGLTDRIVKAWKAQDFKTVGAEIAGFMNMGLDYAFRNLNWSVLSSDILQMVRTITGITNGFVAAYDWGRLGTVIANGINIAFNTASAFLGQFDWGAMGAAISRSLNGVVHAINWREIGAFFALKFNAIMHFLYQAVTTFDWVGLGRDLAVALNSVITGIDWATMAQLATINIKSVLSAAMKFLEETDWQKLGENIKFYLCSIDWVGVAQSVFKTMGEAFGAVVTVLWELIRDAWGKVVGWWYDVAFKDGEFTISGLLGGILSALSGIGTWIKEHIFTPFMDGFKNVFGIHSPSKVMEEQGGFIIEGMLQGILKPFKDIKGWLKEHVSDPFITGFKELFGIHSPSKVMEEQGDYLIAGLTNGLDTITSSTAVFDNGLQAIYTSTDSVYTLLYNTAIKIVNDLMQLVQDMSKCIVRSFTALLKQVSVMSEQSVSYIQKITSALDAIPRHITTVHTIVTKNVSSGDTGKSVSRAVPKMATGGVVSSPTYALIGEGSYPEAVVPLGDSPQMRELVESIASRVNQSQNGGGAEPNFDIHLYIGDREWDSFTYECSRRGEKRVGAHPIKEGV